MITSNERTTEVEEFSREEAHLALAEQIMEEDAIREEAALLDAYEEAIESGFRGPDLGSVQAESMTGMEYMRSVIRRNDYER